MLFNSHSALVGKHAYLSASKYHWMNYDDEKFDRVFLAALAARRGDELHAFASEAIRLGMKLTANGTTMSLYVNQAIGYKMSPEQILYYSENSYGTADAISFRKNLLRVHDLKTGVAATSEHQLEVYAALFCLEYRMKPFDIDIELRIYQSDEVRVYIADPDVITRIMDKIVMFDKRINEIRAEVGQ